MVCFPFGQDGTAGSSGVGRVPAFCIPFPLCSRLHPQNSSHSPTTCDGFMGSTPTTCDVPSRIGDANERRCPSLGATLPPPILPRRWAGASSDAAFTSRPTSGPRVGRRMMRRSRQLDLVCQSLSAPEKIRTSVRWGFKTVPSLPEPCTASRGQL